MDTRKVSAAVGFTLLMGCVVAVVVVIYNGSGVRTSYRSSMEKSWKTRELSMKVFTTKLSAFMNKCLLV